VTRPPAGWLRWVLRLPIGLYRLRLGWLLNGRFLLLQHRGRKSGQPRQTVLEVVRHDVPGDAWYVAAAWGPRADWLRNVQAAPDVTITVGARTCAASARVLAPAEGARELADYARRHPTAYRQIVQRLMGRPDEAAQQDFDAIAGAVPIVAFHAQPNSGG
jgi:deazaflavin-dependent oxidoreductase (nitroreductase family)